MNKQNLIILAAGGSFALLAGAFVFQYLGYAPCKMCIWQRWPHGIAIGIGAIWFLLPVAILPLLGACAALITAAIGFYHTGVEKGLFEGPSTCTSSGVDGLSAEQLLDQIMNAPLIRCDEVAWQFIGLSMASWNMVISLILAGLWIWAFTKTEPVKG